MTPLQNFTEYSRAKIVVNQIKDEVEITGRDFKEEELELIQRVNEFQYSQRKLRNQLKFAK